MTRYRITVRYGKRYQRYHTLDLDAPDVAAALRETADRIPAGVLPEADLVELRTLAGPEERRGAEGA